MQWMAVFVLLLEGQTVKIRSRGYLLCFTDWKKQCASKNAIREGNGLL